MTDCLTRYDDIPVESFDDAKKDLRTGDILLFCGTEWQSFWVKFFTWSHFSHIGMVVKKSDLPPLNEEDTYIDIVHNGKKMRVEDPRLKCATDEGLYIFHSNQSQLCMPDLISGKKKAGVQLNPLRRALKLYKGIVYLRRLNIPPYVTVMKPDGACVTTMRPDGECTDYMYEFIKEKTKCGYTSSNIRLCKACYDGPGGLNNTQINEYFCSELVAAAYMRAGILSEEIPAAEYVPEDLTSRSDIPFLQGVRAFPEVRIDPLDGHNPEWEPQRDIQIFTRRMNRQREI